MNSPDLKHLQHKEDL